MSIIKSCSLFALFLIFVFLSVIFMSCFSIRPWKTIKFISYPVEKLESFEKKDLNESNDEISNCIIGNVFFYFITNGIEDDMYTTKEPCSINFVFESFDKNTIITINSIMLSFDGKSIPIDNTIFPLTVMIDLKGYVNPNLYSGSFKTGYDYNLSDVKEISVAVNVTVNENGNEVTKNLKANALKLEKKGVMQVRY